MSRSYYESQYEDEEVYVTVDQAQEERPCTRCRGTGSVDLHGQDTDCLDCEGYGSILI
jgi:DnaJ-class molecular chaperone